ncbi:hypothetical protein A3Q56_01728, partial [Intoshia linei]
MTKSNNFTTKRTSSSFTSLSNDKNLEDDKNVVKTNGYRGYFSELLSTSNRKNIQFNFKYLNILEVGKRRMTIYLVIGYVTTILTMQSTSLLQPDITKNINLNWNIETKKYSPIVKSYTLPPIDKKNLKNITNYEEYDQNQDESNFTIISEKPKIQKSFYSKPGELPRKIAIERKKRCYKSLNLNELLKELSIDSNQLVPKVSMDISSPFMSEKDTNITFPSYLALEIFDNDDFDCRTPQEWINLGRCTTNNAKDENYSYKPIRAKALLPENVELMNKNVFDENDLKSVRLNWFDVGVFDYNEESKLFTVKRINEKSSGLSTIKRKGDKNTNNKDYFSKTSSKIQRIYLCFSSEDPRIFARRIKHAVNLRSYTEALIRYNLYIDCMPMDGVAEPEPVSMKRILNLAKSVKSLKIENIDDVFKNLENQITIDYCRSMNKIIFDNAVKSKSKQFKFVTLPKIKKKKIPDIATYMDVPVYNFTEIYETFAFNTILTKPEVIQCLFKIKYECDTICNMSLMQTTATKHMRLDEFEQIQSLTTSRVVSFLKEGWINKLTLTIKSCLRDVGKGWYNINQDNHDIYKISKLSKLIEMIKYCMQDSIRYLVMNSLRDYEFLFKEATNCLLDFNESTPWNTDLIFSNFKPNNHTIFYIDLVLEKDNIMFSNELEDFSRTVIDIINFAIDLTQNIPQLQQLIVVKLYGRVTEYLESVGSKEPFVVAIRERIRNYIHKAVLALIVYSRQYEKYIELSMLNVKEYVEEWGYKLNFNCIFYIKDNFSNYESENHTAAQVKEEVELQLKAKIEIENNIPSNIIIGPFLVNTENTRQVLAKKRKSLATSILGVLARKLRNQSDQACNTFKKISQRLYEKPNSIEELDELREWMILVPDKIKEHQDQIDQSVSDYELIEDFCVNLSVDDFNARWTTIGWPNKLELMMSQAEKTLKVDEERFKKAQIQDNANVYNKLDELTMSVAGMSAYTDIGKAHETANEMRRINKQLNETQKLTQTYNNRERLFSLPVTNYDKLKVLMNDFEPYRSLWITVSDWIRTYDSCLDDPLNLIDSETIEKVVNDSYKSLHKSIKHFKNVSDVLDVATTIKNKVQEFKPYIPLLQGLRNPGMRHRHWTELSESIGIPIVPNDSLTFTKCLEMNLQNYVEEISKTAQVAGKEYAIEQALDKMETEWKSIFFEVLPFKETGTCIIKSSEEVSQMLDDHIVMTQGMSFSPFKKPFDDRINNWETKLRITQDVIDEWIFCQKQWLYLEPIFSSEDINLQLPVESKRYQTMDRMWRKIMKNAKDDPMVISLCPDTRLLDNLKECNKLLEQVQKGLSEYLETKRAAFPRFYFLSDDELLEILSQTKDPTAVQPHLRKCFENIAKLEFQDDLQITAMFSGDGERVPFCEKLFPTGNVEDWLLQVERVMKASIRSILEKAINEYSDESRMKWVLMWPGQIVIAGSQLFWTQNVTNWLTKNNLSEGLNMFLKQLKLKYKGKLKNFKFIKQCLKTSEQRLNYLNIKRCKKESTIDMPLENISQINNFEVAINEINKNYYDCESNKLLIEKIELLVKTENLSNIKNLHLNFTNMLINFVENSDIHLKSWTLLKNYFESIDINEMYLPNEFLNVLLESSKVHIANDMILCEILKIIKRISSKEKVSIFLVKHEFLNIIKLIMEIKIQSCNNDETSLNVVKLSLCSFWSTTIFDSTRIHFIKDNYITPIVELLKKYTDHEEIISEIYPAIMSLALEPSSYPLIVDMNIIDYILQGILKFKRSSDLIKNAICAINILCSNSEMCAYQLLLNNDDETEHLSTIIELCLENIDSITMVESYMNLFLDLLFYEEVMHNMKLFNIEKLIFKVCEMYKNSDLDDLRYLVTQDLLPIERQIISPLIVVEVHSREVILKLIEDKVHNINDFEWIKQLRYYWEEKNMSMRIINASFPYEYEYLGNSGRLVITPLTDRCYLTLTGALHLKFGGAPAGPAGTGKTETTKDLAKAFAIQCVVFNCSDQLDYMAMGKFFKGLASSGAWACFDEFNRIYVEVLSVIAQQITTIQKAQQQKVDRFIFEGAEIDLKASCAIFITMNPGYAGRTELPDNLKALFRPVAMMVPDYAMIAEISIFSYGFRDAKNLSKKITITFKLSSEQLSNQNHYDFGMRAVKSVILAAGNLKQQNIDMDESLLTLRAIKDVNVPKFLENDKKLFNGIISDLFPNIDETPIDYGLFYDTLCKVAQENYNLEPIESFIDKCIQLYETTVVRHGLMIVGPTGSGKTMCYQVLRDTMTQLNGEPNPSGSNFKPVQSHVLNPKSITMGQLYGEFDAMTHEWTDGILSYMIRTDVSSQTSDYIWYIFDGPVDAIWIENMNTVLDDNKKLCLASGEIIKLTDVMTMIFEVMDLAVASPATVSRCGMIYLEPSLLGFKPFIDCWLKKIPEIFSKYKEKLQNLFDTYLRNTISFLRENMTEIVSTMDSNLIFSMLNLIDCFFANVVKDENIFLNIPQQRLDRLQDLIEPWFFFSLIWSVGVTSDSLSDRKKFDFWIRNEMKNNNENMMFPEENLVYDYAIDEASIYSPKLEDEEEEEQLLKKEIKWINWIDTIPTYRADPSCKFCDIIVPTSDTTATSFLLKHLLLNNKLVLIVGPTGIGKTLSITNTLANQLPSSYLLEILTFSAKTSVNQTQDTIDNRLDKRRKGVYGPPLGKYCIFFIDDLNMPAPDTFGSQPPIELLRQWSDWKS